MAVRDSTIPHAVSTGKVRTKIAADYSLKAEIEAALRPLVGEPLSDMMRYVGCQKFEFGIQRPARNRRGREITLADWGLVVSCDWRIAGSESRIVTSDDFGPARERRDDGAAWFYEMLRSDPPVVLEIHVSEVGGLRFALARGYSLEVIPTAAAGSGDERWSEYVRFRRKLLEDREQWRFMPKDEGADHLVVTTGGIEAYLRDFNVPN